MAGRVRFGYKGYRTEVMLREQSGRGKNSDWEKRNKEIKRGGLTQIVSAVILYCPPVWSPALVVSEKLRVMRTLPTVASEGVIPLRLVLIIVPALPALSSICILPCPSSIVILDGPETSRFLVTEMEILAFPEGESPLTAHTFGSSRETSLGSATPLFSEERAFPLLASPDHCTSKFAEPSSTGDVNCSKFMVSPE